MVRTLLVAATLLASCGACETAPNRVITEEGTGPANELPLERMVLGTRIIDTITGTQALVTAVIPDGDARLIRYESRRSVVWLRADASGISITGTTSRGTFKKKLFQIPATVRVGMKWKTSDGENDFVFTVTERFVESTHFSPTTVVWKIEQDLADQVSEHPTQRFYAEGHGLLGVGNVLNPLRYDAAIEPEVATTSPALAPTRALSPVMGAGGAQASWPSLELLSVSALDDSGRLTIQLEGLSIGTPPPRFVPLPIPEHACVSFERGVIGEGTTLAPDFKPSTSLMQTSTPGCVGGEPPRGEVIKTPYLTDASSTLIGPDHRFYFMMRKNNVIANDGNNFWFGSYFEGATPRAVNFNYQVLGTDTVSWGDYPWDYDGMNPGRAINGDDLYPIHALLQLQGGRSVLRVIPQPVRLGANPVPTTLITASGLVAHTQLGAGIAPPVPQVGLAGEISVRTSATVRETLVVGYDGDVARLITDPAGSRLEQLVRVELPATHKLVGALRISGGDVPAAGDELLVFTYAGATVPGVPSKDDVVGTTFAWRTTIAAPTPTELPRSLAVSVEATGLDVLVCWPPSNDPVDETGWSLGGAPATIAITTGPKNNCVLVVRDHGATDATIAPGWVVRGPVPGVGVVTISMPAAETTYDVPLGPAALAPLTGGGGVDQAYRYGPGFVITGSAMPAAQPTNHRGTSDSAGHGLWLCCFTFARPLELVNDTGFTFGSIDRATVNGWVEGGGLLVGEGRIALPDGSVRTVSRPLTDPRGSVFDAKGVLADGTACGKDSTGRFECIANGAYTLTPAVADPAVTPAPTGRWHPMGDGSFAIPAYDGTAELKLWRFTPRVGSYTYEAISTEAVDEQLTFAADGSLWALTLGTRELVRVTPTGLQRVATPAAFTATSPLERVVVDERVFLLFRRDGVMARVPRR